MARAAIAEGVTTLTMPAVARRLGVSHSTLYRYVHDRDDLVLAALDLAMREFEWPRTDLGWRDLLTGFADALWRFLRDNPGMAEAVRAVPGLPATIAELARAYVSRLTALGLPARDAAVVVDFVADLTIGTEIAMRGMSRMFDTARGRRSLREIYREEWGSLADLDPIVVEDETYEGRGWLTEKMALLLDGLATRLGSAAGTTTVIAHSPTPEEAGTRPVDRAAIVDGGRRLARRAGLDAVSLRAVAEEVGSTISVLRKEVGDRDGLVVAMLDAVAEDIVVPAPDSEPRTELVALTLAVYQALLPDPWAVSALAVDKLAGPLILPVLERVFTAFRAAGVPAGEVANASHVLWHHMFGAVLSAGRTDSFARRLVRSADSPAVTEVANASVTGQDLARRGIEILVDGLTRPHG